MIFIAFHLHALSPSMIFSAFHLHALIVWFPSPHLSTPHLMLTNVLGSSLSSAVGRKLPQHITAATINAATLEP